MTTWEALGARMVMQATARKHNMRGSTLVGRRRTRWHTAARRDAAAQLYGAGYSYPELGQLFRRDSSTMYTLINDRRRRGVPRQLGLL